MGSYAPNVRQVAEAMVTCEGEYVIVRSPFCVRLNRETIASFRAEDQKGLALRDALRDVLEDLITGVADHIQDHPWGDPGGLGELARLGAAAKFPDELIGPFFAHALRHSTQTALPLDHPKTG